MNQVSQVSRPASTNVVVGDLLSFAAILIVMLSNDSSYKWAIGVPIVLAVIGVGLRIEAALVSRSG